MSKVILVTGAAGFIGFHTCIKLLKSNFDVIGLDNINSYYDVNLKNKRLSLLSEISTKKKYKWKFVKTDLINKNNLLKIFDNYSPNIVINLAAQAGVRYSLKNPTEYINSNIIGFHNILECCKKKEIKNLLYASSSSVYGGNTKTPFSESDSVSHPVSVYAATKRSNELLAHTYSHLYNLPSIGLRFFTVYGPWGRPDMAPMIFTKSIIEGKAIKVFNNGEMSRSFTYIDDVTEIIERLTKKPATEDENFNPNEPNPSTSWCPHRILNIGNDTSIQLNDFISCLEKELGINAIKEFEEMQPGDVVATLSDNNAINNYCGNSPKTPLNLGIKKFVNWYREYY